MRDIKPPIVVVAFNRAQSLKRLLDSLSKAYYPDDGVTLIISIDKKKDNQDVLEVANQFQWRFGEKKVYYQLDNLGLRKHIIKCASYCNEYGNVIILEDDLFVSPQFYNYACQALEFSNSKAYIGGVSLYNHQFNVNINENFSPVEDGFDNWYLQFASSWGQAWTKEQWNGFYSWYANNLVFIEDSRIPNNVTNWSDKSWLKYYIKYLVETNKYFLYPKISLTTNFGDAGTHMDQDSTLFQVPLDYSSSKKYVFSDYPKSKSTYDVFFENNQLHNVLQIKEEELCVDLYGTKPIDHIKRKYLLTRKIYDFNIIRTFGAKMKPIETNIFSAVEGSDIYLYNTSEKEINKNKINIQRQILYNIKHISRRNAKRLFFVMYYQRLIKLFKDIQR